LTGIVTTDAVIVSPEIQGRLQQLLVREGDAVTNGQLLAVIQPQEQQANMAFSPAASSKPPPTLRRRRPALHRRRPTLRKRRPTWKTRG